MPLSERSRDLLSSVGSFIDGNPKTSTQSPIGKMALKDTITIVLILTTFASIRVLFPASEGFLAVSTHKLFFSLHFWTMLTAGFYERFVPLVIVDIVVTAVAGSFLDKKWKPGELL
eukprot:600494_1